MQKLLTCSSLFTLATIVATSGCMAEAEYTDRYEPGSVELLENARFENQGNLEIVSGFMRGDVGGVRDIDSDASLLTGYGDPEYASIEVHAETADGAAMNLVEIYGGLDELEPGMRRTFSSRDEIGYEALGVQVLNCSGDQRYDWAYDAPADEVTVQVSEADEAGVLRVDYTARTAQVDAFTGLPTGGFDEVDGRFDVVR